MYTNTLLAFSGAVLKNPANVVVEPSPVAVSLVKVGALPAVAKLTQVEPSVEPSYIPVCVLNLMIPVAADGLDAVSPCGIVKASVELAMSNT